MNVLLYILIFITYVSGQTLGLLQCGCDHVIACNKPNQHFDSRNASWEVGKVSVNQPPDGSSLYSFNENFVAGLEVAVRVFVVDESGNEVISPVVMAVNVTCELAPGGNGYSDVSFTAISTVTDINDTVPFSILSAGRETTVACWGEAVNEDPTAPVFSKETSIGDTGVLQIRPAGTVSVCAEVTVVSLSASQSFILVELSEAVENGNATVVCSSDTTGVVDPILVTFTNATLLRGAQRAEVSYTVVSVGNPVPVSCYAASELDQGINNTQFHRENSTGLGSMFMEESVSVEIIPLLTQIRTTEMTSYLVLSSPATTSVQFTCELGVSQNLDQAREWAAIEGCDEGGVPDGELSTVSSQTTDLDMGSSTTTDAPVSTENGTWFLQESLIVFTESEYYKPVEIFRQGSDLYSQLFRPEVVTVRCCTPGVAETTIYDNRSATFATVVYLDSNYSVSWDAATDPLNRTRETEILNPAYVEVSPCPCDLTERSCDIGCCCDEFCTDDDKETFTCIQGIQGGEEFNETPRHLCSTKYFDMPDWSPIMCVMIENSAFLGYFRQPEAAIRSRTDFNKRLNQYSDQFNFRQAEMSFPLEDGALDLGYKDGLSLKTGLHEQRVLEELIIGPNYRLVLPGRSTSGQCVFSDPVAFLKESSDTCVWEMAESLCSLASPLNALNYALPTKDNVPSCRKGLLLLAEQAVGEVAVTNVDYHCADQEYLEQRHLRSLDTEWTADDQVRLFDQDLPNSGEDCQFDDLTGAYLCENLTIGGDLPTLPLPPRCDWDNGYTAAPTPSLLDNSVDIPVCLDSVLEVRYNFTWKGPRVVQLHAIVVIGNISLQQEKVENTTITYVDGNNTVTETVTNTTIINTMLTQLTSVEWHHQMNESLYPDYRAQNEDPETDNASVIFPRTSQVYQRSGKIGYELSLPVWSGISVYSNTENQFQYVDTNLSSQLSIWKPGADSLCEGSDREYVNFRENALGSCLLRLGLQELTDCDNLRKLVLNKQDALMLSNYIGLSGDPDPVNLEEDWVKILRQDLSNITVEIDPNATSSEPEVDPDATYAENLVGRCENIPSHINVDIMYAEVGLNNGLPLRQIIGARISYTLRTWSLYCTAADGAGCLGNTTWLEEVARGKEFVQSFILSSSVNFIEGPHRTPEPKTRYQESQSYGYFVCKYDTCWTEAFYPFRPGFEGDSYQYTLPVSLASLVFLIGLFAISRPWW